MKLLIIMMVSLFVCSGFGCESSKIQPRMHEVEYFSKSDTIPSQYGDNFDWQNKSPIDFLEMLKKRPEYPYTVLGVHKNWIRKSDIPYLIELLDSSEPCAPVQMAISSYFGSGSTIGEEAAFLILGFKKGQYPPGLNSTRPRLHQNDKDELKKWWQEFK